MILLTNKRYYTALITKALGPVLFILASSFDCVKSLYASDLSQQRKNNSHFQFTPNQSQTFDFGSTTKMAGNSEIPDNETYYPDIMPDKWSKTADLTSGTDLAAPYFILVYSGNGIDHMNINLVSLNLTGLKVGDEIGVFDDIYCVGSAVIKEKDIFDNSISIPASANDNGIGKPTGYTPGHTITLKAYRNGTVYRLFFQTVNNSFNIFEIGGSMFALVNFSQSTGQIPVYQSERTRTYPNPFDQFLKIEIYLPQAQLIKCEIFDINGILVRTLFENKSGEQLILVWDGKDNDNHQISSGIYFCRVNQFITKIIYRGKNNQ